MTIFHTQILLLVTRFLRTRYLLKAGLWKRKRKRTPNNRFRFRRHNDIIVLLPDTICEKCFFDQLCTYVRLVAIACFSFPYLSWGENECPSVLNWRNQLQNRLGRRASNLAFDILFPGGWAVLRWTGSGCPIVGSESDWVEAEANENKSLPQPCLKV